jgi:hypothetical protein
MVIGERFAWGHLPKTGGDATLELFQLFPDLVVHSDTPDGNEKHATFASRWEQVRGKDLILNVRQLPSWILSFCHHANQRGLYPDYKPLPMLSPREMSELTEPDRVLSDFLDQGAIEIRHWLRMENLAPDFLTCVGSFREVSADERARAESIGRVNAKSYDHVADDWFTPEQVALMYRVNPRWAAIERRLYPDPGTSNGMLDVAQISSGLERPELQGSRIEGFEIHESGARGDVFGWVVPRTGSVRVVRIRSRDRVIVEAPLNRIRPDVAAAFPETPFASQAGFRVGVDLASLQADGTMHVEAVLSDGVPAPIGTVRIQIDAANAGRAI